MFRIVATGVREALHRISDGVAVVARQVLGQAAAYAAERARATTTFKDRTGELRRRIDRTAKGPFVQFVKASTRYALFVEDGTRAHVIRPRRRRALRFVMGGQTVFRTSVRHPGTKATYFMRDARDDAEKNLTRFFEVGLRPVVSG
jgi:hypothetical protein